jgi:hypothetical protein
VGQPHEEHNMKRNRSKRMKGAYTDILLAYTIIVLPMLVLSGALLGLVFHYRVTQSSDLSGDLQFQDVANSDNNAYLVDFSATRLTTVASWTSSVAPMFPVFVMTLYSSDCSTIPSVFSCRPNRGPPNTIST